MPQGKCYSFNYKILHIYKIRTLITIRDVVWNPIRISHGHEGFVVASTHPHLPNLNCDKS